jgi:hypothetical protein
MDTRTENQDIRRRASVTVRQLLPLNLRRFLVKESEALLGTSVGSIESITVSTAERFMTFRVAPWCEEFRGAVRRIEQGTYGKCCLCQARISQKRLNAFPLVRFCGRCEHLLTRKRQPLFDVHSPLLQKGGGSQCNTQDPFEAPSVRQDSR